MKKFALLAATAAIIAGPASAGADWFKKTDDTQTQQTTTTTTQKTSTPAVKTESTQMHKTRMMHHARRHDVMRKDEVKVRVSNMQSSTVLERAKNHPMIFPLAKNNDKVEIRGRAIYLIQPDGRRFLAPNGPYTTRSGVKFLAEDGLVLRAENPDKIVYIDTDMHDRNHDGRVDSTTVHTHTQKAAPASAYR